MKKYSGVVTLFAVVTLLISGCAISSLIEQAKHGELEVQTQMSKSIFIEPSHVNKKIWVQTGDTSGQNMDLGGLGGRLVIKGYEIVTDPDIATFRVQVNTLFAGKASKSAIDANREAGFGTTLIGLGTGAIAGYVIGGGSGTGTAIGGFAGAMGGYLSEWFVGSKMKTTTYTVVTDVRIQEKINNEWKTQESRITSTATKFNLSFEEAKPSIVINLLSSISGIF